MLTGRTELERMTWCKRNLKELFTLADNSSRLSDSVTDCMVIVAMQLGAHVRHVFSPSPKCLSWSTHVLTVNRYRTAGLGLHRLSLSVGLTALIRSDCQRVMTQFTAQPVFNLF